MSKRSVSLQPRTRTLSQVRRRLSGRPVLWIALSAMAAVAFSIIVYFASTSVAWFATSPTSDRLFGNLNHCLLAALPTTRAGFAVSPDGRRAASFAGKEVAICEAPDDPRREPAPKKYALGGVTQLAWDYEGTLWVATAGRGDRTSALWRIPAHGEPTPVGDVSPVALAGHARGVVALDARGKLISLGGDGEALGFAELPGAAPQDAQLSVDASGQIAALVGGGGVWMFDTRNLSRIRAEAPCDVEFLWWLTRPAMAMISCGPRASWALVLHALTGERDEAPRKVRERSVLVPKLGVYVRGCDGLPCEADEP